MKVSHFIGNLARITLIALFVTACATPPEDPEALAEYEEINDPLEPTNRKIFVLNQGLDRALFKPLAKVYVLLPDPVRGSIGGMIKNVSTPVNLANDILQGEFSRAGVTLGRFVVNSTVGIGGMIDVASRMGMEHHSEDFGQTLAVWGSPAGPYVVIPVFGPSSPRAIVGRVTDSFLDPLSYLFANQDAKLEYWLIRGGIEGIDERARVLDVLDDIEEGSLDFYATVRSLYRQRREAVIENGEQEEGVPGPSFMTHVDDSPSADKASLVH
tara:strand:- start:987 stop:1796 length:810 start_codon:yes stop_codon:yes gene_type:complete